MKAIYCKLSSWILLTGLAGCGTIPVISKSELALNGVEIGQAKQAVISRMGMPIKVIELEGHHDSLFEYKHVDVYFYDGEVDELYTDDISTCTALNVCPGNSLSHLRKVYGRAPSKRENGKLIVTYLFADSDCWIDFLISENRISSINAKCPV